MERWKTYCSASRKLYREELNYRGFETEGKKYE
jgi:hypothetical protein